MVTALISIHVTVCIFLILIILLQSGKGATMGASLGAGSGETLFGPAGPASLLTKITTGVAIVFMITSLALAVMSSKAPDSSVMENISASQVFPAPETKILETKTLTDNSINKTNEQASQQAAKTKSVDPAETKQTEPKTQ